MVTCGEPSLFSGDTVIRAEFLDSPCCGEVSNVFSKGGGEEMAKREKIHFLGRLPVDTELVDLLDNPNAVSEPSSEDQTTDTNPAAFSLLDKYKRTPSSKLFADIASQIVGALEVDSGQVA